MRSVGTEGGGEGGGRGEGTVPVIIIHMTPPLATLSCLLPLPSFDTRYHLLPLLPPFLTTTPRSPFSLSSGFTAPGTPTSFPVLGLALVLLAGLLFGQGEGEITGISF